MVRSWWTTPDLIPQVHTASLIMTRIISKSPWSTSDCRSKPLTLLIWAYSKIHCWLIHGGYQYQLKAAVASKGQWGHSRLCRRLPIANAKCNRTKNGTSARVGQLKNTYQSLSLPRSAKLEGEVAVTSQVRVKSERGHMFTINNVILGQFFLHQQSLARPQGNLYEESKSVNEIRKYKIPILHYNVTMLSDSEYRLMSLMYKMFH